MHFKEFHKMCCWTILAHRNLLHSDRHHKNLALASNISLRQSTLLQPLKLERSLWSDEEAFDFFQNTFSLLDYGYILYSLLLSQGSLFNVFPSS